MKKTLNTLLTAAALGAIPTQAEPTKGFNAVETLHTGETRAYTNAGFTFKDFMLNYHGTHIFSEGGEFSNHRIAAGFKDNPLSVFLGYKTNYDHFSEERVGFRFEKPIADYGYLELATNGDNVSFSAITGKFFDLPILGKTQFELLSQLSFDGDDLSHYGELYMLKGENLQPFVMLSAKDMDEFKIFGGLRYNF